ncbi:hypothetical protein GOBAR_AA21911 [Gossypium barbadense]|uniref:Uncharacterized protein n=1 Tax=Gossypium barbadense TaxID=3634 RepID=A0A2P5X5Z8_GOSBA|nr:hypothetical protein GOBAR_AA21911 [Gossypium barbadense]
MVERLDPSELSELLIQAKNITNFWTDKPVGNLSERWWREVAIFGNEGSWKVTGFGKRSFGGEWAEMRAALDKEMVRKLCGDSVAASTSVWRQAT